MFLFSFSPVRPAALVCAFLAVSTLHSSAHEYKAGPLVIGHPWSRATPAGAKVASGYLSIQNTGTEPDRLVSVASEISEAGEIHQMSVDQGTGVMTMRPVAGGLEIAPGETVALEPGAYHLMFVRLKTPPKQGDRFKGTLTFERAGSIEVDYAVEAIGGRPGGKKPEADHGSHGQHAH